MENGANAIPSCEAGKMQQYKKTWEVAYLMRRRNRSSSVQQLLDNASCSIVYERQQTVKGFAENSQPFPLWMLLRGRLSGYQVKVQMLPGVATELDHFPARQPVLQFLLAPARCDHDVVAGGNFVTLIVGHSMIAVERQAIFDARRHVVNSNVGHPNNTQLV